ncbi:hypothetical protein KEJ27_09735 [Candidatus Bathyarchaeota archaeon]|nr:hypothetical protein [Candidatus Bathyarchaeota archaeon]
MRRINEEPFWILQAVKEIGLEFRYTNLLYWAYGRGIKPEEVYQTLKSLVGQGYLTPVIEVRCPECGAHLGDFRISDEIPEEIPCDECGHEFNKREEWESSYNIVFTTTDAGRRFFRKRENKFKLPLWKLFKRRPREPV